MKSTVDITIDIKQEGDAALIRRKVFHSLRRKILMGDIIDADGAMLDAIKIAEHDGNAPLALKMVKRAIDARHGKVRVFLRYEVALGKDDSLDYHAPKLTDIPLAVNDTAGLRHAPPTVVIVGTGPAGIFAAFTLLQYGIHPILVERGERTMRRKQDIAAISVRGVVDGDSNYCFGEGGAGTFSDGKLYTRSDKRGDIHAVYEEFVRAGANMNILTDSHPHIGTDKLPAIVTNMVDKIIESGGECRFHTRCTGLIKAGGRVRAVVVRDTHTGEENEVKAAAVLLATGHSAADIYTMLYETCPDALVAKGFAVGVRVEHPRSLIDAIQYHGAIGLPAAEYRLKTQVNGRGVYSFCMCPGGFVVPSATGPHECVVNGMSSSSRNSKWSNSAIVMEVRVGDERFLPLTHKAEGTLPDKGYPTCLSGLIFRTALEREAYNRGDGKRAPAQRLTDFLTPRASLSLPPTSYTPSIAPSRIDKWLPSLLTYSLTTAIKAYDSKMQGFITEEATVIAIETRTSTPVRIRRNEANKECPALQGLYAAGECSGYAGGITSCAMDGQNVATAIATSIIGSQHNPTSCLIVPFGN